MAVTIGKFKADNCGFGVSAPKSSDLHIGSMETTRCHIGLHLRDDIPDADLVRLLNEISSLEAKSEAERISFQQAIELIQQQLSSPSPIENFTSSLRNIVEGATGSALYTVVATMLS